MCRHLGGEAGSDRVSMGIDDYPAFRKNKALNGLTNFFVFDRKSQSQLALKAILRRLSFWRCLRTQQQFWARQAYLQDS